MPRGTNERSPANIASFLEGIDFPASINDLVNYAEDNNAPEEVIDIIEQFPVQTYNSMDDVMVAISLGLDLLE